MALSASAAVARGLVVGCRGSGSSSGSILACGLRGARGIQLGVQRDSLSCFLSSSWLRSGRRLEAVVRRGVTMNSLKTPKDAHQQV